MALVLPLLLMLVLGGIEYGWMFLKSQQITNAARHGARVAVRPDSTTSDAQSAAADLMNLADLGSAGYTISCTPGDISASEPGELIRVDISVPYDNVRLIGGSLIPTPSHLGASVTMAREGP
jgi:hypothetical protein